MSDEQTNPLQQASAIVNELRLTSSGDHKDALDQLADLLDAAQRRGAGDNAEALRHQIDEIIALNAKFVSVMVHEIRVPMTSIKGYSDMLAKGIVGPLNDQQTSFMETIRTNVSRMQHLVSDISDISKIQSGRMRLEPKMDMYKNVAMQVEKNTADLAAEHEHTLTFDTPSGLPLLNLDSTRLAQVLEKLIVNAIQYTPDGGEIVVKAEDADGNLRVSVVDNGIGIAPDEQARIGELFWRGESEHVRAFKGHGLGLPIAMGFIQLLGGEFFYESAENQGSTFGFVVPGMKS